MEDHFLKLQLSHGGTTSTPIWVEIPSLCEILPTDLPFFDWLTGELRSNQLQNQVTPQEETNQHSCNALVWLSSLVRIWIPGLQGYLLRGVFWWCTCLERMTLRGWLDAAKRFISPVIFVASVRQVCAARRRSGERRWRRKTRLLFSPLSLPVIRRAQLPTCTIFVITCAQEKR